MKPTSLFIALSVLFHLLVIDLALLLVTVEIQFVPMIPIGAYNVIWLLIALTIGKHSYKENRR